MDMPRFQLVTRVALIGVLLLLTCMEYSGVWTAEFVYEDWNATGFSSPAPFPIQPLRVRALTRASYRLDRWMSGNTPRAYHLTNLALHCLNGVLVGAVIAELGGTFFAAAVGMAIFLLSGIQSEAVAYIAGRTELLSMCGLLLGSLAVLRRRFWAALVCLALAVSAKESAVVGVGLFGLLYLSTDTLTKWPRGWMWAGAAGLLVLGITSTVYRFEYTPGMRSSLGVGQYAALQAAAFWRFVVMMAWPFGQSVDHDFEIVRWGWQVLALVGLLWAAAIVALVWLFQEELFLAHYSAVWIGMMWVLIALAPRFVMRIPEVLNEHQLYLSMGGVSIAGASLLCSLRDFLSSDRFAGQIRTSIAGAE